MTRTPGRDYTIELWSLWGNHFASCSCGWSRVNLNQTVLESLVKHHKECHTKNGDAVEVI